MIALLLDPEKTKISDLEKICTHVREAKPDFIFVGGSTVCNPIDNFISVLQTKLSIPIVLFPGSISQFSPQADALLFLSLISGRNPEFLIGQHVSRSLLIKQSDIETIPTGYILVNGGNISMVESVSQTTPIPNDKIDIAISTAIAGEMLGLKLIYLEAGSGAKQSIPTEMIREVKKHIRIPLIVGGGIKSEEQIQEILQAGADLIVVGNYFETNLEEMQNFCRIVHSYK